LVHCKEKLTKALLLMNTSCFVHVNTFQVIRLFFWMLSMPGHNDSTNHQVRRSKLKLWPRPRGHSKHLGIFHANWLLFWAYLALEFFQIHWLYILLTNFSVPNEGKMKWTPASGTLYFHFLYWLNKSPLYHKVNTMLTISSPSLNK